MGHRRASQSSLFTQTGEPQEIKMSSDLPPPPSQVWLVSRLAKATLEGRIRVIAASSITPDELEAIDGMEYALREVEGTPSTSSTPKESQPAFRAPTEEDLLPLKEILFRMPEAQDVPGVGIVNRTVQLIRRLKERADQDSVTEKNLHEAIERSEQENVKLRTENADLRKKLDGITTNEAPQDGDGGVLSNEEAQHVCALCRCEAPPYRVDRVPNNAVACSNHDCSLSHIAISMDGWIELQSTLSETFSRFEKLLDERFMGEDRKQKEVIELKGELTDTQKRLTIWKEAATGQVASDDLAKVVSELSRLSNKVDSFGEQLQVVAHFSTQASEGAPELTIRERLNLRLRAVSEIDYSEHSSEHAAFLQTQNAMRMQELEMLVELAEYFEGGGDSPELQNIRHQMEKLLLQPF